MPSVLFDHQPLRTELLQDRDNVLCIELPSALRQPRGDMRGRSPRVAVLINIGFQSLQNNLRRQRHGARIVDHDRAIIAMGHEEIASSLPAGDVVGEALHVTAVVEELATNLLTSSSTPEVILCQGSTGAGRSSSLLYEMMDANTSTSTSIDQHCDRVRRERAGLWPQDGETPGGPQEERPEGHSRDMTRGVALAHFIAVACSPCWGTVPTLHHLLLDCQGANPLRNLADAGG